MNESNPDDDQQTLVPKEKRLMDRWQEYWENPPQKDAIKRLIDRIQFRAIYKAEIDMGRDPKVASKNLIHSLEEFSEFPDKIPNYKDGKGKIQKEKMIDHYLEFKKIINKREIGSKFRSYYKNIYSSKITSGLKKTVSFLLILTLVLLLFLSLTDYSPIRYYFYYNIKDLFGFILYLSISVLYCSVIYGIFHYFIGTKIRPSKLHWFDTIFAIAVPIIFYLIEFNSNLLFFNLTVVNPPLKEIRSLILYYNLSNLILIILFVFSVMAYCIIPCTLKGQLFYSLLNLETSAKIGGSSNVKKLIQYLNFLMTSLNELLMSFFSLSIENVNKIQETFNKNLLNKGLEFLPTITFLDQESLLKYFSEGIIHEKNDENSKIRLGNKIRKYKQRKLNENKMKNEEYFTTLNSMKYIVKRFESIAIEPNLVRITFKNRLFNQIQKTTSYVIGIGTFLITVVLPLALELFL